MSRARPIVNRSGGACLPRATAVLFRGDMSDDTLLLAIGRLERAVHRLEERLPAALAPAPARPGDQALHERYERLEERHRALRERTSSAVERLTRLLDAAKAD